MKDVVTIMRPLITLSVTVRSNASFRHCITIHKAIKAVNARSYNPSVTGGPRQVLLWPGGPGGTRRKHRPGWAENRRKHRISAEGGGRPWPPPPPRRNHRLVVPSGPTEPPGRGARIPRLQAPSFNLVPPIFPVFLQLTKPSPPDILIKEFGAPIAQLDRAPDYESVGRVFESPWARQYFDGNKQKPVGARTESQPAKIACCSKSMKRKAYHCSEETKNKRIGDLQDFLRGRDEVVFAYIFGSFVEEETFHDIDLGIYLSELIPHRHTSYGLALSQALSNRLRIPVDVRILNSAPASFLYHVIRGKLLIERDEEVSARIAEQTIQRYLDLKPLIYRGIKEAFGG